MDAIDFETITCALNYKLKVILSRDPGLDLPEVLRSYLPAFMSLGTGLGIALHSLLYRWLSL